MTFATIFLILVAAGFVAAMPSWSYSRSWGYGPAFSLGLVLVLAVMIFLVNSWA
jgi:hypothetical protein